jgi:dCMP deaminase
MDETTAPEDQEAKSESVKRPAMTELMMQVAHLMASRSTCLRLHVGCVITDIGMTTIYSIGYNGNYRGGPNECDRSDVGDCGCLHAEDNALVKLRTEAKNLMLFTTHSPCPACAKRIVNQGSIRSVWYGTEYRDATCFQILRAGDVSLNPGETGDAQDDR